MEKTKPKKIDFKFDLRIYWDLVKKYKLLFFGTLLVALLWEALGIADKFLFKIIIDDGTLFAAGSMLQSVFVKILLIVAFVYIGIIITKVVLRWIYIHILNRLDMMLITDLKRKFLNHLIQLSHSFHTSHKTGSLISRLSRGGRAVERMTDTILFNLSPLVFQVAIASASLAVFDWLSAIIIFITIIVFIVYSFIYQQITQKANMAANDAEDFEKANIGDIFTNIDSIKYFGKEEYIKDKFFKISNTTKEKYLKHWDYYRWLDAGQSLIIGLGTFILIYFSMTNFLAGKLTLGTLVFVYTVYVNLLGPLFGFVRGIRDFYEVMADFDSLFQYAKIERDVKDKENAKELEIKNGEVEFKNVLFNYGNRKIFDDFNLKISKNEKVALVGHSGSGKTTLIKLLYRLYDVNSGSILVDGSDIRDINQESLRNEMSIVPQECILFDDTIYNNIAFSRPNANRSEVMKAIKFAQLDKFVNALPLKENTVVGERGVKLSGGEKQRVSIARAILANKKILVLDEATSSLDSETEHEIQKDLEKLMEGRTSIIIAHRLSTIMKADRIIVMKNGKIEQMGSHSKLIRQPGEYRKLWELQKGGYID